MYKIKVAEKEEIMLDVCDEEFLKWKPNFKKLSKSPILNNYLSKIREEQVEVDFIPTGLTELDVTLGGGLRPGLYIIGANPGIGKTSLMLHLINNLALNKNSCLLLNLEMSPFQITTKLLSNHSYKQSLINSDYKKMTINELSSNKTYGLNKPDIDRIVQDYDTSLSKYITVVSKSEDIIDNDVFEKCQSNYVERIETALKNYKLCNITPIIVVDFLQLLKSKKIFDEGKEIDRRLEMNEIIERLKKYSNVYNAPIILISSLSRHAYTKEVSDYDDINLNLSAFKESGSIEYQADFLAVLTEGKKISNLGGEDDKTINVTVLKTRFSAHTGETFTLKFKSDYSYFEEIKS